MKNNIDEIMKNLAEYTRIQEETKNIIESLKDELKQIMDSTGVNQLVGSEHKATWKDVASIRIDTTMLKKMYPAAAADCSKTVNSKRFTFV